MKDREDKVITLDLFQPRDYQLPIFTAFEKGYTRVIACLPRRAGKDLAALQIAVRACLAKVGTVFYIWPTYAMAKRGSWEGITIDGVCVLDYIPKELIRAKKSSSMQIIFTNGSILQFVGSNKYNNLIGVNAMGMIFSEYAVQDPRAYQYLSPVIVASRGWILFVSTPRGKNHFYRMYQTALQNPNHWFAYTLTVEDTKHITEAEIQQQRDEGLMSEDLILQEYYCRWDVGIEGAFYGKMINQMYLDERIGSINWDPAYPVHTAWDLGVARNMAVVFFQVVGNALHIIDFLQMEHGGLDAYIKEVLSKPYTYGKHIAPHDVDHPEISTGLTRYEVASSLGLHFINAPDHHTVGLHEGIEAVRRNLNRTFIDERRCAKLIKALENYRQEFDSKKETYKHNPLKDWSSHPSDAVRYMMISLNKLAPGMTPQELDEYYRRAKLGPNHNLPKAFQDPRTNFY